METQQQQQGQVSVKVAVRIRPQISREKIDMCQICTSVTPNEPQVWLGKDKAFTYDHVFDTNSQQQAIYEICVKDLVEGCFNGYNATVLAYGQTGSGKTYTMGTGFELNTTNAITNNATTTRNEIRMNNNNNNIHNNGNNSDKLSTLIEAEIETETETETTLDNHGIIPRAVQHLFEGIQLRKNEARKSGLPTPEFKVTAQFIELYNEEIIDLFSEASGSKSSILKIHEENGSISIAGATSRTISSAEEAFESLRSGALSRTTASTKMNTQSSRSHAIFTIHIKQNRITTEEDQGLESLSAKFHFVDLAGSERLKRTGATGDRAKEGISINSGLLCLGNVISALGDKAKRATHIPYRDSKLTRLLQDSLGGNSQTLMIACISPSDRDFMETLSTLRYANRAKNIKNSVTANHDTASHTIAILRKEIQHLQLELLELKQGKRVICDDGTEQVNDMYHENAMLLAEVQNLKTRVKALQEANERLVTRNAEIISEREYALWSTNDTTASTDVKDIVQRYLKEIEELRLKLMEMEETCSILRKQNQRHSQVNGRYSLMSNGVTEELEVSSDRVLQEAKREVKKLKAYTKLMNNGQSVDLPTDLEESGGSNETDDDDAVLDNSEESSEDNANESIEAAKIELAELNDNITIKEQLIAELEKSQRKMQSLKHHYESKLIQLQNQISEIEHERDQVMAKLNQSGPNEKTRRLNEDYDKKIKALQGDVKKLQDAKREHANAMRIQARSEQQIKKLRVDVDDMKRQKVNVMNKMREEAQRHRESELRNTKKIAQLTKQDRLKDVKIRNLEVENNRVKQFLKRRDAEVKALKTKSKPMSERVAGRAKETNKVPMIRRRGKPSPKAAKHKWGKLEHDINQLIVTKETIWNYDQQMSRDIAQREELSQQLEETTYRLKSAKRSDNKEQIQSLKEDIDAIRSNIDYIDQNVREYQSTILQLEDDLKDDADVPNLEHIISNSDNMEVKYLFQKVVSMLINQTQQVSALSEECRQWKCKYKQVADTSRIKEELLDHLMALNSPPSDDQEKGSRETFVIPDPVELPVQRAQPQPLHAMAPPPALNSENSSWFFPPRPSSEKARRLTWTPQELLFEKTRSALDPINDFDEQERSLPLQVDKIDSRSRDASPVNIFNEGDRKSPLAVFKETTMVAVNNNNHPSPPASPLASRRTKNDENVFSRLTSNNVNGFSQSHDRIGAIEPTIARNYTNDCYLVRTHVATGHTRPVLTVAATDDVLFSGSKDFSCKIWDLHTCREIQTIADHPDAVQVVRYNEYDRLLFCVSKSYIFVYDPRQSPANCVKVLLSSGIVSSSNVQTSSLHRGDLQQGEARVLDIQLASYGTALFSTCSNIVRVWDLRKFHCVGKLNTGHQAPIICMAVNEFDPEHIRIATGSKDHYIKLFDIKDGLGGFHQANTTLKPPHYDGIESLKMHGDYLFSASRDSCIKKWNVPEQRMCHSINQAHKDWILALTILPNSNHLISGCRSGYLRLWSKDHCSLLDDIKAHNGAIHAIETNNKMVFTASSDNTVGLWQQTIPVR